MSLPWSSSLASDDSDEDGRRHHPVGVGRGALDRGKEAAVLGTVGRLRRLAAMVGGEYARDDGRAGRYFLLLSGNYRFLFRPLYEFFRCKTVKKLRKVTVLQRKNSLSCQLRQIVKKLCKSQL
jgi:hypothetical protein